MVLLFGTGRQGSRPFHLLAQPPWPVPGERHPAVPLRDRGGTLPARRPGGRRRFAVDASLIAADANKRRSVPGEEWRADDLGDGAARAVREYLATLDDAAFGAASEITPKFISRSDPAAQWTGAHKGHFVARRLLQQ